MEGDGGARMDVTPLNFDGILSGRTDSYEISRGQYRKAAAVDATDWMTGQRLPQALYGIVTLVSSWTLASCSGD